jgi:propionyl-CoA carboxylase beta chain
MSAEPLEPGTLASTTAGKIADFAARHEEAVHIAEKRAVDRQHPKGKLTARERIDLLLDPGSFVELDEFVRHRCTDFGMGLNRPLGDGVVTGHGTIDGRRVCVFSQDFSTLGGSMGEAFGGKVLKVMDLAMSIGCPIIGINDSGGARIQEGVVSLALYAELGRRNVRASGMIPQISLIMGPCAGGAVYSPAITDFTVMVDQTSYMFVTGPDVLAAATGERISPGDLGGPAVNAEVSGNTHYVGRDEPDAIAWVQTLLAYLPSNHLAAPPIHHYDGPGELTDADRALDSIVPDAENQPYDMYQVIGTVADDGEYLEIQRDYARNIICALTRIGGRPVGVIANQPMIQAGALDIAASSKAARFVRFCDCFEIPLVTFTDVPGYLPGVEQERGGIIRHGAKLIYAYAEATVPKVTVVVRKAYGGGYAAMGCKHLGADINLAWPTAEIAVIGSVGAVPVLHRRRIAEVSGPAREQLIDELTEEYERTFNTPYIAAERGYIDQVIRPAETRMHVVNALDTLRTKRVVPPVKKHGNIPL